MKKLIIFSFRFKGKTEYLLSHYLQSELETVLLYPNFSRIKEVKKIYCGLTGKNLLPEMLTVKTLALKLIEENSEKKIIDELRRYAILLKIISNSGRFDEFSMIGITEGINNLIKDIKTSFEKFPDYHLIKKEIENYPWKFEKNKDDLLFAFQIIEEYENYIQKNNFIDIEDIYNEAEKYIGSLNKKRLIIENFYEILPSQRKFFSSLVNNFPEVIFAFSYDEDISPDVKELILDKTINFVKGITEWQLEKPEGEKRDVKVECYSFPSQDEEIKGIGRLISMAIKEKKLTLDDFSIVCPDMPEYRDIIHRILSRYNIPCELIPGYTLNNEPSVVSLLQIFIFIQTFDWKTLMGILTSPYFKNISFQDVKKFSCISRDKFKGVGFSKDDFYRFKNPSLELIKESVDILDVSTDTLKNWIKRLLQVIEKLKWKPSDNEIEAKFYDILDKINEDFYVSPSQFLNILKKTLEFVEVEEVRGEGLRVSGVIESTGLEKEICFFAGATEENFPNAPKLQEIFMPDKLRTKIGLPEYKLRIARDRLDMHRILSENTKVIFTYPVKIGERSQMKSIFLFNFEEKTIQEESYVSKPLKIFNFDFSLDRFYEKFRREGKIKIGVTALELFLRCRYKFYLRYIKEIEPYAVPEIAEAPDKWGTIIHNVMKEIFENYKGKVLEKKDANNCIEEFKEKLFSSIKSQSYISEFYKQVMLIRAEEVIEKFKKIILSHTGSKLLEVEYKIEEGGSNYLLEGRIDRIERNEKGIYIIDIKTGTSTLPSFTRHDFFNKGNIQIPVYMWMYRKKFNPDQDVYGAIWNFTFKELDNKKGEEKIYEQKKRKVDYLDELDDYFNHIFGEMLKGNIDFQPEENQFCYLCDYRTQCPNGK